MTELLLKSREIFNGSTFDINTKNRLGQSPLHIGAKLGFGQLCTYLVKECKADLLS